MNLYGKTLTELSELAASEGLPKYSAGQIAHWLYRQHATSLEQMTNLPKAVRQRLSERHSVQLAPPIRTTESKDGTKKYLFAVGDRYVETAYIPEANRSTLCVSSQVGCAMGCEFCATGRQGFQQHLSEGQILNQLRSIPEFDRVSNIVFMGMGEPLNNLESVLRATEVLTAPWGMGWSPKRITVSTVGLLPPLRRFLAQSRCHLAVSMHTPFADERASMMPVERAHPIAQVVEELRRHRWTGQRRVSFEYTMIRGLNDTPRHVEGLLRLLAGLECRINLIALHPTPDSRFSPSPAETMVRFRDALSERGITTTIRASRGLDINAACGLLSTAEQRAHIPSSTNYISQ
ncbi:MAG: 23S rRNA (adenine(2503)-C(2))-methyltransferase RlmN [Bacteroidales bacterium]|nr:23S rRNA (adenine(2503)-C(2))-methyltransferase RlmN [Bacteroidales bacterium]